MSELWRSARRGGGLALVLALVVSGSYPPGASADGKRGGTSATHVAVNTRAADATATPTAERCAHVVRRGESLGRIATQHRVSRQSIVTTNHLAKPDALRAGQRLQIPGCKATAPVRRTAEQKAVPPPTVIDDTSLIAKVGPRRIPTRLFMSMPEFNAPAVEFQWPVDGSIISGFGQRSGGWHAGVDIRADGGSPIRAAAAGTVLFSGWERTYGRMVRLQHPGGFTTVYAHNFENLVQVADEVEAGAIIASVGRTGHASGPHLHFEIRRDGMAYNPLHLLDQRDAPVVAVAPPKLPDDDDARE